MSSRRTIILGVESSCDETACAVVADGREVLSNAVATQIDLHRRFGGVVPEVASRAHIEAIGPVLDEALAAAGVAADRIDAVAVTSEPGLVGSLLVGLMAAKTLAWVWGKPLIAVNHVHAHVYSPAVDGEPIAYPAVGLVISGGHTALYAARSPVDVALLGQTIDDAAGEAFDKVAAILQLGYPGGPVIDRAARGGDPKAVRLPRTLLAADSLDFSFSGLKTAVLYHVNGVPNANLSPEAIAAKGPGYGKGAEALSEQEVADIAAGFQSVVADVLAVKVRRAVKRVRPRSIVVGGGVAANSAIRARLTAEAARLGVALRLPPMKYCTDNAAMIAAVGYHLLRAGRTAGLDLEATPTMRP
ncbi:MAG: tRNA (adenosine(37)-N6)-threonylcarbamoyltransferase complex transferase subunit TsaD [Planctomycetes bacterium]|nr:tRNA (adenosine(37)-N6)-threonylcarbamoyltransferase complex transferase subunit TsaD [Planctomycetota bacterium]